MPAENVIFVDFVKGERLQMNSLPDKTAPAAQPTISPPLKRVSKAERRRIGGVPELSGELFHVPTQIVLDCGLCGGLKSAVYAVHNSLNNGWLGCCRRCADPRRAKGGA